MTRVLRDNALSATASLSDWLDYIGGIHPQVMDFSLERVRKVYSALSIEHALGSVVLVGGTNGKGSTCRTLEHFALCAGLKTGTTMSPHLHRFNERIRVGGCEVADESIVRAMHTIEQERGDTTLTYFEFALLAALLIFADNEVDLSIVEIGLGGRLDAANILDPAVSVITSIGLDHQQLLGDTREAIAAEKAGIARVDRPLIFGEEDVPEAIAQCPAQLQAAGQDYLLHYDRATECWNWHNTDTGETVRWSRHVAVAPSNVACALQTAHALDLPISAASLDGLRSLRVPGRFECFSSVDGSTHVILDVAHNEQAAQHLLLRLVQAFPVHKSVLHSVIFGTYKDKDSEAIAASLASWGSRWHQVSTSGARGLDSETLTNRLRKPSVAMNDAELVSEERDIDSAFVLASLLANSKVTAHNILVCGSFEVVSKARMYLLDNDGFTRDAEVTTGPISNIESDSDTDSGAADCAVNSSAPMRLS